MEGVMCGKSKKEPASFPQAYPLLHHNSVLYSLLPDLSLLQVSEKISY